MSTMNVSLPAAMKSFIDEQVIERGYDTSSEYVRDLIRKDQQRLQLRGLLLQGGRSAPAAEADKAYFDRLRERVHAAEQRVNRVSGKRRRQKRTFRENRQTETLKTPLPTTWKRVRKGLPLASSTNSKKPTSTSAGTPARVPRATHTSSTCQGCAFGH